MAVVPPGFPLVGVCERKDRLRRRWRGHWDKESLIVELKKGAFELTQKELDQARDYAKELRRTGCAPDASTITAFVLGADLEAGLEQAKFGSRDENIVTPLRYDTVLARAHARTFNLQRRLEQAQPAPSDPDVDQVLSDVLPTLLVGSDQDINILPRTGCGPGFR
jgi:hypothetical protein